MHDALTLFGGLETADVDWILGHGREGMCPAGQPLTVEGQVPEAVSVILDGLFDVRLARRGNSPLARMGPGELVGEMSFLSGDAASASVVAVEDSRVLAIPRDSLQEQLAGDSGFAARFYKSLARIIGQRLRERESADTVREPAAQGDLMTATRRQLTDGLSAVKDLLLKADAEAIRGNGTVPAATARRIHDVILETFEVLNRLIGEDAPLSADARRELGRYAQREFLPYLIQSQNGDRFYAKPRGYAGDFQTIEFIYENQPTGSGRLGPALDAAILDAPTSHAVRNRRALLAGEIQRELDAHPDRIVRVSSFACGPARELFDIYQTLPDPSRLVSTLLDIDFQALAFVSAWSERARLSKQIHLRQCNLVYLALGRETLKVEPQDLIYSVGLIDYFEDKFVIRLLNFIHGLLRPGGRTILGNFHPRNTMRAVMDHVVDWKLIHRSEEDMNRLFAASAFGRPCTRIQTEAAGINLFAECSREA